MGKYEPLESFLSSFVGSRWRATFAEVEQILGFKLPASAYKHAAWWSNDATGHSHARAWLKAGWRTEEVDLAGRKVTFRHTEQAPQPPPGMRSDPWGCLAGTVRTIPGVDLTSPTGETWNADVGKLVDE